MAKTNAPTSENVIIGNNNKSDFDVSPMILSDLVDILKAKDSQIGKVIGLIEKKDDQIDALIASLNQKDEQVGRMITLIENSNHTNNVSK